MFPIIEMKSIGNRIKLLMKQRLMTARDVQENLNLSCVQSVYHWLNGSSLPSVDNLYALSVLFGVSIDYLVSGTTNNVAEIKGEIRSRELVYFVKLISSI